MFGAQKAAEQWARTRQKKDWTAGHAEGRAEERKNMIAQLRARASSNPQLLQLLDELANDPPPPAVP